MTAKEAQQIKEQLAAIERKQKSIKHIIRNIEAIIKTEGSNG